MESLFSRTIKAMLWTPLEQWLVSHPLANWLLLHPLMLVTVFIAAILLTAGLFGAIARATEGLWVRILKLPFQLLWGLLRGTAYVTRSAIGRSPISSSRLLMEPEEVRSPQQELTYLLSRLDAVKQEEAELMKQIRTIVQQQL